MSGARAALAVALVVSIVLAGVLQVQLDAHRPVHALEAGELYVRSSKVLDRLVLSYDALVADIYWIRAIQHFGGERRSEAAVKRYDLLFPLLDLTTSLDPYFGAAYYFGSFFLAEPFPSGAGRPDLAVTLLRRAVEYQPESWRFLQHTGFIYYWYAQDFSTAAEWFRRAAALPDAPPWVRAFEATTRAAGGDLESSRQIWLQMIETAESDWMRETARFRLMQTEALMAIDVLERIVTGYALAHGVPPTGWTDLIREGRLRDVPLDPTGMPFVIGDFGNVTVSFDSRLHPLPERPRSGS